MFGILVNPSSGTGQARPVLDGIRSLLRDRHQDVSVYLFSSPEDVTHQVDRAMKDGCTDLVCMGGDGTLSNVVNCIAGKEVTLYVVPCGTGNDFARALKLPKDPLQAFCKQLNGSPVRIDCGSINGRHFINVSGSGFDVEVLRKTEELKPVCGNDRAYRKALFAILSSYRPSTFQVSLDNGPFEEIPSVIIEIANGQYIGGGLRVAPDADLTDGLFDVIVVRPIPAFLIALLFPLLICGLHVRFPFLCRVRRARRVVLRRPGMVVNIDGELEPMNEAEFVINPGSLTVRR